MRSLDAVTAVRSILKGVLKLTPVASNPTPANGDVWVTPSGVQARVNGKTIQLADDAAVKRQALLAIALGG